MGSTDRGGVTWRALFLSVRSSSRRVASYPFSSSEEERAGSPSPTAGRVPGGTTGVSQPAPAGDCSPLSRPLGLDLRSSAPAERSRLGLSGSLSPPPAGGADFNHSSAVVSLDFDWFSSSLSWPSRGTRVLEEWVSFLYARCNPLLHRSLEFNVGVSPALFLPFSLLCYGRFLHH